METTRREFLGAGVTSLAALCFPYGVQYAAERGIEAGNSDITGALMCGDIGAGCATIWAKGRAQSRFLVEYSFTPEFREVFKKEGQLASPENDFTGRAQLSKLPPATGVFYRVTFPDAPLKERERVGHFRTPATEITDVNFLWSGDLCGQGYGIGADLRGWPIFKAMHDRNPDFYIQSGDYIYADNPIQSEVVLASGEKVRQLVTEEKSAVAQTLDQFRGNYRYNLQDPALRQFFQHVPIYAQMDDHEVLNNWYPGGMTDDVRYQERSHSKLALMGQRAFLDYLPVSLDPQQRLFNCFEYGPLLDVFRVDLRSFRSANSSNLQEHNGDEAKIFGASQISWLKERLLASKCVWKVIACDMPLGLVVADGDRFEAIANNDPEMPRGREHEVADLLRFIRNARITNVVWLTADVHYAAAHHYDPEHAHFRDFNGFWEFVAGPLHAGTFGPNRPDRTFGLQVEFSSAKEGERQNQPPSPLNQFFGSVSISSKTKELTVGLHNVLGQQVYSKTLSAGEA